MQVREKGETVFFQWFVVPEGRKVGSLKRPGAEPSGHIRDAKLHAVVARSKFRSQNVQNTPFSEHFWKLRWRNSARRRGAKHIRKWKCEKHHMFGPLFDVQQDTTRHNKTQQDTTRHNKTQQQQQQQQQQQLNDNNNNYNYNYNNYNNCNNCSNYNYNNNNYYYYYHHYHY